MGALQEQIMLAISEVLYSVDNVSKFPVEKEEKQFILFSSCITIVYFLGWVGGKRDLKHLYYYYF